MYADELAKMEVKLKEQLKTNENLKLQLAAEEDRYKVSSFSAQTFNMCGTLVTASDVLLGLWMLTLFYSTGMTVLAQGWGL